MDNHQNARLTIHSREQLARKVLYEGLTLKLAAASFNVSAKTAAKWTTRYREGGAAAANVADSCVLPDLLHGEETEAYGDQAYQGQAEAIPERAPKAEDKTNRRWRTKLCEYPGVKEQKRLKSKICSRVEHVFAVMKLRFGFTKVRYRGLAKNLHRIETTCALINL